jgi:hypothetical protein
VWTSLSAAGTATTFNITGLTPATPYWFRWVAGDTTSNTSNSNAVSATTDLALAPGTVTVSPVGSTTATLTASGASHGTPGSGYGYQFQVAPDATGAPGAWQDVGTAGPGTTLNVSGLNADSPYWARVRASDATTTANSPAVAFRTSSHTTYTVGPAMTTTTALPRFRDRDAYREIERLLELTGEFQVVPSYQDLDEASLPAGYGVFAKLTPIDVQSQEDANPWRKMRTVAYGLVIVARLDAQADAYDEADRLENAARNAIEGQDYGFCDPRRSTLSRAAYDFGQSPDLRLTMRGQFRYTVNETVTGYTTTA